MLFKKIEMTSYLVNLRFLDFKDATKRYLEGHTATLDRQEKPVVREVKPSRLATSVQSKSENKVKYPEITNEMGRIFGYIGYIPNDTGHYTRYVDGEPVNCMYCLRPRSEWPGEPWHIPVAKEHGSREIIYHGIDIFCCAECTLAECNARRLASNPLYVTSIVLLHEIYVKRTGRNSHDLKPASDRRLLRLWNGPLNHNEFHACHGQYTSSVTNIKFHVAIQTMEKQIG